MEKELEILLRMVIDNTNIKFDDAAPLISKIHQLITLSKTNK